MSIMQAGLRLQSYRNEQLPETNALNPAQWAFNLFGSRRTPSGVDVDAENAISLSTLFGALLILSESVAQLPFSPYESKIINGVEKHHKLKDHSTYKLVAKRPNDLMTSYTWRKMMMNQLGKYDRAYSIIRKDRAGRVIELFPIPSRWVVLRLIGNELVYEITDYYNNGEKYYLSEYSVFHLIGYTEDGLEGRSRINILKNQIGGAIASEDFASEFYGKGVNVSGFIKTKKMLKDQDAVERLKSSFVKAVAGKNNTFGVGLLEDDADWIPNEMDPNKAQLSEARKLNALTVAQMYNMPLQLLKYAEGGGKTQEQLDLQYLKYTLTPYLVNWEQEAERKLLTEREKDSGNIYYKFNINALLRGDMVSRGRYYESMTKTGAYTPNKILSHEDEDGFEGGDVHIIPSGYQTLESLDNAEIQE